eukprot:scaffold185502_cov28-Tisochrysis_lutea.AAC.1
MAQPRGPNESSPLVQALGAVAASMRARVVAGDMDLIGVLLFGTEQTSPPGGMENTCAAHGLDLMVADELFGHCLCSLAISGLSSSHLTYHPLRLLKSFRRSMLLRTSRSLDMWMMPAKTVGAGRSGRCVIPLAERLAHWR